MKNFILYRLRLIKKELLDLKDHFEINNQPKFLVDDTEENLKQVVREIQKLERKKK